MASRCRSLSKPTFSLLKSAITTKLTTTSASLLLTSLSSHNLSRTVSRLGCVQSLLPLHSAVSAARLTWWPGIDAMSSRSLSQAAAADVPRLTRFSLQAPKCIEVEFANGSVFELSAEFLRVHSPAADGKMRSVGGEKVIFGRRHVGIMKVEPIGNYGVRIIFDDLHKTGIYTWEYFYNLGSNKFTLMRNYINTLKKHGLSRDPLRRK